jgi:LCP family protein required for cell wall assembly
MIRRIMKETWFFLKNQVSLPLLITIALAACSPTAAPTPTVQPTPTVPQPTPPPVSANAIAINRPPVPLPSSHPQHHPMTILLLGADRRNSNDGASNTDTLMLFRFDPDTQRIAILSLPRDLYVEIPGHEQGRINTAYAWGEEDGTGGLSLARRTVSTTLGIPVQHAALLDFNAFVTLIDAIGGVDVDVPYTISDPTYPDSGIGYDPFDMPAGQHHLDGVTALKYARTRATSGGDFDRTARQRQLVFAVRDRVTQLDLLTDLIAQSPQLWATLQGTLETDLTLGEIVELAATASHVPTDQIVTASIDQTATYSWTTPSGAQVLLPNQDAIEALLDDLLAPPPTTAAAQ